MMRGPNLVNNGFGFVELFLAHEERGMLVRRQLFQRLLELGGR
jgi:hypothetical protein